MKTPAFCCVYRQFILCHGNCFAFGAEQNLCGHFGIFRRLSLCKVTVSKTNNSPVRQPLCVLLQDTVKSNFRHTCSNTVVFC